MLFKNPTILFALFALIIPIIIHLFKLRKFQKVLFSNVAMLQKIKLQTRKSAQLKKWLVLISRLLAFTCIILAFCQPYLPSKNQEQAPEHLIIYLDNSFSMEAKGSKGPLLKRAIYELINDIDEDQEVTLFTNNALYKNTNIKDIQNDLLRIDYSAEQLTANQINLKFNQLSKNLNAYSCIAISDFQNQTDSNFNLLNKKIDIVHLKPETSINTSVDSLWLTKTENNYNLNVKISGITKPNSVSVKDANKLLGKFEVTPDNTKEYYSVPLSYSETIEGSVHLDQASGLGFDDVKYFSLNKPDKINVVSISNVDHDFLKRIYSNDEFNFNNYKPNTVNYAKLNEAQLIILNEIDNINQALKNQLIQYKKSGGTLTCIPSKKPTQEIIDFLKNDLKFNVEKLTSSQNLKLTQIHFTHPLLNDVFSKQVFNFQYPSVESCLHITEDNKVLSLENDHIFLNEKNNTFLFSGSLSSEKTNFKNSPLIVPCFYNMAKTNALNAFNYLTINQKNNIKIPVQNKTNDQVIKLKLNDTEIIPLQSIKGNFIEIFTGELPNKAGNYKVSYNNQVISNLSYNYNSNESELKYFTTPDKTNFKTVSNYFLTTKADFEITELWKWFIIFALLFLLIEILLLKYLK